jgi:DNA-binding transcriptional LysR family regulator
MSVVEPAWDIYRSFLAVSRQGSLSAAARVLGITQPTVGRHIAQLEHALGGRALFTRSPSGFIATAAARELRPHAEAMESAAAALLRRSQADEALLRGVVRITTSNIIGSEVLPPMLGSFRAEYRGIELELHVDNAMVDMLRRDADIAVRMFKPSQKQLLAKRIGFIPMGLYAHRRYLDAFGMPRNVEDFPHHTVIGFDAVPPWLSQVRGVPFQITRSIFAVRCDDDRAQLASLRAGVGICACQTGIARRDPDLVPVLPGAVRFELDLWLVMHADQRKTPHVRALFEHLAKGLKEYQRTCV